MFASNGRHAADANKLLRLERQRRPEHVGMALHTIELASDVRLREEALRFLVAVRPPGVRWRDMLNPALAIGQPSLIRRVVGQIIANEPLSPMRSWMLSAEVALVLGDLPGAASALRQAEHFDDGHPDLALLGVVLSHQMADGAAVWQRVEKLGNVSAVVAGEADALQPPAELELQRFAELLLSWLDALPAAAIAKLAPAIAAILGVASRRRIAVAQVQAGDRAAGLATLRELAHSEEVEVAASAQRDLVVALQEKTQRGRWRHGACGVTIRHRTTSRWRYACQVRTACARCATPCNVSSKPMTVLRPSPGTARRQRDRICEKVLRLHHLNLPRSRWCKPTLSYWCPRLASYRQSSQRRRCCWRWLMTSQLWPSMPFIGARKRCARKKQALPRPTASVNSLMIGRRLLRNCTCIA